MPNTVLDLFCLKGETWTLSLALTDAGIPVPLTGYTVYFTIVEDFGITPIVDVGSNTPGQTIITIVPLSGSIEIKIPYLQTQFEFSVGHYSVLLQNAVGDVTYLLICDLKVIQTAKQLVI